MEVDSSTKCWEASTTAGTPHSPSYLKEDVMLEAFVQIQQQLRQVLDGQADIQSAVSKLTARASQGKGETIIERGAQNAAVLSPQLCALDLPLPGTVEFARTFSPSTSGRRRGPRLLCDTPRPNSRSSKSHSPSKQHCHSPCKQHLKGKAEKLADKWTDAVVPFHAVMPGLPISESYSPISPTSPTAGDMEILSDGSRPKMRRSKSSFEGFRTEDQDKHELRSMFELAESCEQAEQQQNLPLSDRIRELCATHFEMVLDSIIGILIVLNAIFIGISMDTPDKYQGYVLAADMFFSAAFIVEIVAKLVINGFAGQFKGDNRWMNMFDAALIFIDLVQLGIQLVYPDAASNMGTLPSASIFRVVRLARLIRILRLLRHPVLQTLLMMLHGMIGGLPTLGWALLLFIMTVYVVALMFREFLGREEHEHIFEYFNDVPRAMVTTFRCSFGECVTVQGTPIFEHVDKQYGMAFSLFYCLFAFAMSIGMFNVISAIFVQSTLAAATALTKKQKKARLQDERLWAKRVQTIMQKLVAITWPWEADAGTPLSALIDTLYDLRVDTATLDELGDDADVKAALDDLDVDPEDHQHLSDILDAEQRGDIAVIELLQGLRRLRGNPRRSDIVAIDLTCRAMQNTLKDINTLLSKIHARKIARTPLSPRDNEDY
eukprot:TRINITY_DN5647_c0_g2_i1.p1 TRINITY_DN5647_c0_g2~~TRINITY_DN5647_c0_g2_i1.p1  ORF type:complete len:661 (-),score=114.27 TRINITY_DN5647_c0_g2_i1:244-2226(-)